jgi:hypothetical protein
MPASQVAEQVNDVKQHIILKRDEATRFHLAFLQLSYLQLIIGQILPQTQWLFELPVFAA